MRGQVRWLAGQSVNKVASFCRGRCAQDEGKLCTALSNIGIDALVNEDVCLPPSLPP